MAFEKHFGQVDKAGAAYIQHPLKVMSKVHSINAKIIAVLHDILEDTATSVDDLQQLNFSDEIIAAVLAMTKKIGENRYQAMQRTVLNPLACEVKLADLSENMDLSRLKIITPKDLKRLQQYKIVQVILQRAQVIYQQVQQIYLPADYPKFVYTTQKENYQYLLNAMFDQLHPFGGCQIDSPMEWWILFEDISQYLTYCQRRSLQPNAKAALILINKTDRDYMDSSFQDTNSQTIFKQIIEQFLAQNFH